MPDRVRLRVRYDGELYRVTVELGLEGAMFVAAVASAIGLQDDTRGMLRDDGEALVLKAADVDTNEELALIVSNKQDADNDLDAGAPKIEKAAPKKKAAPPKKAAPKKAMAKQKAAPKKKAAAKKTVSRTGTSSSCATLACAQSNAC